MLKCMLIGSDRLIYFVVFQIINFKEYPGHVLIGIALTI